MNRVKFEINNLPVNDEKYYIYTLKIGNNTIIYRGKVFKLKNTDKLIIDTTDILNNYRYRGYGILSPIWRDDNYLQPTGTTYVIDDSTIEQHYNTVTVEIYNYDDNSLVSTISKVVYFHTIPFEGIRQHKAINGKNYYFGNLVPRMPITNKLRYGQLIYSHNTTNTKWNNINLGSYSKARVHNIAIPSEDLHDGDELILKVDKECIAPYYLAWLTSDGGFQCQPFKSPKIQYDENYTINYKLSTDEQKDIVNKTTTGKWKLFSNNITEEEYKVYADINRSPYLLLYISEYDTAYYVNSTSTTNTLKTDNNQDGKPLYFEVEVETRENVLFIN